MILNYEIIENKRNQRKSIEELCHAKLSNDFTTGYVGLSNDFTTPVIGGLAKTNTYMVDVLIVCKMI